MNRRSVFKTIASAICASAVEVIGIEPVLPKPQMVSINPEWLAAEYEDYYIIADGFQIAGRAKRIIGPDGEDNSCKSKDGVIRQSICRLNLVDGQYVEVYPYVFE
jgi:hypothetical protein